MPSVTTQYRMFVPRRRRIGGGGSTIDLGTPPPNQVTGDASAGAPDLIEVSYPDAGSPAADAKFAFWSVQGSADGEYTARPTGLAHTITVHTGSSPVTLTAWYVFVGVGGSSGGSTELETDAFLVDENAFVEPTPIQSVNPADAWDPTDWREFVETGNGASSVVALETVVDPNEEFEAWYVLEGGSTPMGRSLGVPQDDEGIAIATYRIPPGGVSTPKAPPRQPGEYGQIIGGVAVDGPGFQVVDGKWKPVPPWGPVMAGIAVYEAARGLSTADRARVQAEALRSIAGETARLEQHAEKAPAVR